MSEAPSTPVIPAPRLGDPGLFGHPALFGHPIDVGLVSAEEARLAEDLA